jgi:hypothetical protein
MRSIHLDDLDTVTGGAVYYDGYTPDELIEELKEIIPPAEPGKLPEWDRNLPPGPHIDEPQGG